MPRIYSPFLAIPAFSHRSVEVPIHELDRAHVAKKGPTIRPFKLPQGYRNGAGGATPGSSLRVTGWSIFHASKKAELLRNMNRANLRGRAVAWLLEQDGLFSDKTIDLRLGAGQVDLYGDFSKTSLAGRIAQGMAFLFMDSQGYRIGERLESFVRRMNGDPRYSPHWRIQASAKVNRQTGSRRAPDFIFESPAGATALVESKGGFVPPASQPAIKSFLREGLAQIGEWLPARGASLLNPAPAKGYVVGTYLREEGDTSGEPSGIVFVDPDDATTGEKSPPYRGDLIGRANYAAWLKALGFYRAASALRDVQSLERGRQRLLPCLKIGGRFFAFTILLAEAPVSEIWAYSRWDLDEPDIDTQNLLSHTRRNPRAVVCGIETGVLDSISRAIQGGPSADFLRLDRLDGISSFASERVSVLSDGTLLGEFGFDELNSSELEWHPFML